MIKAFLIFLGLYVIIGGGFIMAASKPWPAIKRLWRSIFPRTIRQFEQTYCSICDGRIWFWQSATRLYSLGMTRAHVDCAASYIRSSLEEDNRARLRAAGAMLTEIRQGLKNHSEGDKKHEKHYKN